jgi:hypothetical protein
MYSAQAIKEVRLFDYLNELEKTACGIERTIANRNQIWAEPEEIDRYIRNKELQKQRIRTKIVKTAQENNPQYNQPRTQSRLFLLLGEVERLQCLIERNYSLLEAPDTAEEAQEIINDLASQRTSARRELINLCLGR